MARSHSPGIGTMIELDAICREAAARRAAGERLLLATVVRIEGSSYRRPGARMLVGHDRWISGCVSGGCLEDDVVRRAEYRLHGEDAVLVRYDSTSDDDIGWGFGVGCNGVVEILIERLGERADDPLRFASSCFERESEGIVATVFASSDDRVRVGARLLFREGVVEASSVAEASTAAAIEAQALLLAGDAPGRTRAFTVGGVDVLLEKIVPVPHVFIVGSRHDARPLLDLVRSMGLRVSIVDTNASVSLRERFRDADRILIASPADLKSAVDEHHSSLAVLMTHDYERDLGYLGALLSSTAKYIGVLGPSRRTARMLAELEVAGHKVPDAALERLHSPIGLDIDAETPREIALSIVSEMQAALANAPAGRLRERHGPIHAATTDVDAPPVRSAGS